MTLGIIIESMEEEEIEYSANLKYSKYWWYNICENFS